MQAQAANIDALTTPRLRLAAPSLRHVVFISTLHGNVAVRQYLGGPKSLRARMATAFAYCRPSVSEAVWIVRPKQRLGPVGLISVTPHKDGEDMELSYQFHPRAWGQGYAMEAGQAVCDYAFTTLGLARVIAETQAANAPSRRLLERLGMRPMKRIYRFGDEQIIYAT